MFTIITAAAPNEKKPSFLSRGGRLSYVSQNGVSFAVLRVRSVQNIKWPQVKRRLGNSAGRIVCGPGVQLPEKGGMEAVDTRRYSHLLAQNGLTELLKPNRPLTYTRTAVLIDLNGQHQAFADILVRFFKTVRIITRNCELYQSYVDSKFYECGATVLIAPSIPPGDCADLFVSPDGVFFRAMENTAVPVITSAGTRVSVHTPVISDFQAPTPAELDFAPAEIDSHIYQAALFECCGVGKLGTLLPVQAKLSGIDKSMNELKMFLFSVDNKEAHVYN